MKTINIDQFIANGGGLNFPNVPYRRDDEAHYTSPFGIDKSKTQFFSSRVHLGTDRGKGKLGKIYAPFNGQVQIETNARGYGTLVRIRVADEFEIRIGHMSFNQIAIKKPIVEQGQFIGFAGTEGKSTGIHTHTEIVSLGLSSNLCDEILKRKFISLEWYSNEELEIMSENNWPEISADINRKQIKKIGISRILKFDCWSNRLATYYDSRALFNI